jgi:hypothetical protein
VPGFGAIVCGNETDALSVFLAAKAARAEWHRLKGYSDIWGMIKAEEAAREIAVLRAYSCQIIHQFSNDPLTVEKKEVSGGLGRLAASVTYTVRQDYNLFYVMVGQDDLSPFKPVRRQVAQAVPVQTAPQPVQSNPEVIPGKLPLSLDPRDHGGQYGNPK